MTPEERERRDFIGRATALLAASGLAGGMASRDADAAATPQRVVDRGAPAAASGTLRLGGDLEVARMGFGAMRLTGDGIWGEPRDAQACRAVLRRTLELGVNFIDTADSYGPAVSERLIAEALHPYPRGLVIATKGGLTRPGPNKWVPDCRPEHLRAALQGSLKRLKVSQVDLYQLHTADPKVPYEDSLGEVARLQQEGLIRHVGISNVNVEQLAKARAILKVVSVQNRYNVTDRGSEAVLQACEQAGIAFIPWGPLARMGAGAAANPALAALDAVAKQRGIERSQALLAWLLAKSKVMLPIPGTSRLEHLEENVAAANVRLDAAEMQRIG
ncbi:MAG: aldo/keto reductase [Steroidobacteraceae bacterium]|jgi:aryl-alcohol dehydrogenase-like predicted oxidoreductase|nr:aldo/keto reductase [Steroidobacteraceae bacterium]